MNELKFSLSPQVYANPPDWDGYTDLDPPSPPFSSPPPPTDGEEGGAQEAPPTLRGHWDKRLIYIIPETNNDKSFQRRKSNKIMFPKTILSSLSLSRSLSKGCFCCC